MSHLSRAETNRQNAAKSTGPRTPEGKARSSRNATTHGLTSNPANHQFEALLATYLKDLAPHGAVERDLVHTLASMQWQLTQANLYLQTFTAEMHDKDPLTVSRVFDNFSKQQTRLQRSYAATLALFRTHEKERKDLHQARLDNVSLVFQGLRENDFPASRTFEPQSYGFDFTRAAMLANHVQWLAAEDARISFPKPSFRPNI